MDVPISFLQPPSRIVNQAIDMLGEPGQIIGAITDGTLVAETARRNYGEALRQLLRASHWAFARQRTRLTLLGDATGTSAAPVIQLVEPGWTYAYAWPTDAVQGRWLPWTPWNAQPTNAQGIPLTTGSSSVVNYPQSPGRFLVSSSSLYPVQTGVPPWNQQPDLQRTEGVGPIYRKIILTNCAQADFVYTRLVTTIEEWDDGFRQAMVMMMAMVLAPVALKDPKLRLAEMARLAPVLKNTIDNARLESANESGYPMTTDHQPVWMTARSSGWWGMDGGMGGPLSGNTFYPYDSSFSWCGSVF